MARKRDRLSDDMIARLRREFGDHNYDYEMTDYNLATLIEEEQIRTFEQLEPAARELEGMLRFIHAMQERMKE